MIGRGHALFQWNALEANITSANIYVCTFHKRIIFVTAQAKDCLEIETVCVLPRDEIMREDEEKEDQNQQHQQQQHQLLSVGIKIY